MYEEFYGLKEKPFRLTPDPKFLYLSTRHREALEHLAYGISQKEGFILITGEIGTGKTTICRALLERSNGKTAVGLLFNPFLSEKELLKSILTEFGCTPPLGATRMGLLENLNQFLLHQASSGETSVLIIDEAQNLSFQILEQIRILSNLETEKDKLLQIVLVGQSELRRRLKRLEVRQLDQRIPVRYHLQPLDRKEIPRYIYHRLAVAGSERRPSFSKWALRKITRFSKGVPRLINLICDRSLLNGYAKQRYHITAGMVVQAAKTLRDEEKGIPVPSLFSRVGQTILLGAILILGGWLFYSSVLYDNAWENLTPFFSLKEPQSSKQSEWALIGHSPHQMVTKTFPKEEDYTLDKDFSYTLLVASFRTRARALKKIQRLHHINHSLYISKVNVPEKGVWFRVLVGKFETSEEAHEVLLELKKNEGIDYVQIMRAVLEEGRGKVE